MKHEIMYVVRDTFYSIGIFYLAVDFLGDTKYQSMSEEETKKWISLQWNAKIYRVKTIKLCFPINKKGERI
jgi:hypothetical protein